jgi:hypothetical protein
LGGQARRYEVAQSLSLRQNKEHTCGYALYFIEMGRDSMSCLYHNKIRIDLAGAHDEFKYTFPVGTSVQNARTSYAGDTVTRDGFHMNYDLGRYMAALTWLGVPFNLRKTQKMTVFLM